MATTLIRNAAWIVAWDAAAGRHAYLRDADLAFSGNSISFLGRHYAGAADETIDGRDLMLIPGLVDIHSHPSTEPFFRGIREEHGVPAMFMSGLYERSFAFRTDAEGRRAGKTVAYCEMLRTGITTVADLSGPDPWWIDLAAQSGLRVFLAPGLRIGALAPGERMAAQIRLGCGGRDTRVPRCACADRSGDAASERPAVRHRVSGADRYLHRGTAARKSRSGGGERSAVHHALRAERQRVQRNGEPPWPHADRLGARHRGTGAAHDPRARDLHRRALLDALAHQGRCAHPGGNRHLGCALSVAVRALWPHAGGFRPLSPRRREHGDRHGCLAAQSDRGDAPGGDPRARGGAGHQHDQHGRHLSCRDGGRRAGAGAGRYRPAGGGRTRRSRD